jgi:chromosome segregation ATPase
MSDQTTPLEEQVSDLTTRLAAQESHYEGIRAAIHELRRDLLERLDRKDAGLERRMENLERQGDILRQEVGSLRQEVSSLERSQENGFAEVHRSLPMLLDRRDVSLLQRSVHETMRRLQVLEEGQQETGRRVQVLEDGQQEIRTILRQLQATLQEVLSRLRP